MGSDSNLIRIWRMNGCVFVRGVGVDVGVGADLDKEFFGCDVWVLSELLEIFFFLVLLEVLALVLVLT